MPDPLILPQEDSKVFRSFANNSIFDKFPISSLLPIIEMNHSFIDLLFLLQNLSIVLVDGFPILKNITLHKKLLFIFVIVILLCAANELLAPLNQIRNRVSRFLIQFLLLLRRDHLVVDILLVLSLTYLHQKLDDVLADILRPCSTVVVQEELEGQILLFDECGEHLEHVVLVDELGIRAF